MPIHFDLRLHIVRMLVERHGGTVLTENRVRAVQKTASRSITVCCLPELAAGPEVRK